MLMEIVYCAVIAIELLDLLIAFAWEKDPSRLSIYRPLSLSILARSPLRACVDTSLFVVQMSCRLRMLFYNCSSRRTQGSVMYHIIIVYQRASILINHDERSFKLFKCIWFCGRPTT
jgi:hypothetical protein